MAISIHPIKLTGYLLLVDLACRATFDHYTVLAPSQVGIRCLGCPSFAHIFAILGQSRSGSSGQTGTIACIPWEVIEIT